MEWIDEMEKMEQYELFDCVYKNAFGCKILHKSVCGKCKLYGNCVACIVRMEWPGGCRGKNKFCKSWKKF